MDSDCTGGRAAMQFDTASQNKINDDYEYTCYRWGRIYWLSHID
jgi:hypothetical protein